MSDAFIVNRIKAYMQPLVKTNFSEHILNTACSHFHIPVEDDRLIRAFSNLIFDWGDKFIRLFHSSIRAFAEIEVELDWLEFVNKKACQ